MTTLELRFVAGRYHATPWYTHVNEGAVEWPPSPWRVLRALLASGLDRATWREGDGLRPEAHALVSRLASVLPSYRLPRGAVAHTRHYMPISGGTTKVLDAFLRFDSVDAAMRIHFPVELPAGERALLADACERLTFFGRAESWVEGRLVDGADPSGAWSRPAAVGSPVPDDMEHVLTLCPMAPDEYLASKGEAEPRAGKKGSKAALPNDVVACLLRSTGELQDEGWSQPPGSRRVLYLRPRGSLEPAVGPPRRAERRTLTATAVVLSLSPDTAKGTLRPRMERLLPHMETLHDTAIKMLGSEAPKHGVLTGHDTRGERLVGHRHVHWLPLGLDDPDHIDHVLVWAPGGMDEEPLGALRRISRTWGKALPGLVVTWIGEGDLADVRASLRDRRGARMAALSAGATRWTNLTPFIAPRHLKPRGHNTLQGQVRRECESRGLPAPEVEVLHRDEAIRRGFLRFVRARREGHPQPPGTIPWALVLTFPEPISGPLTLGYGAHFGMGMFIASEE